MHLSQRSHGRKSVTSPAAVCQAKCMLAGDQLRRSQFSKLKLDSFLTMLTEEATASIQATCAHIMPFFVNMVANKPEEQQVASHDYRLPC